MEFDLLNKADFALKSLFFPEAYISELMKQTIDKGKPITFVHIRYDFSLLQQQSNSPVRVGINYTSWGNKATFQIPKLSEARGLT